MVVDNELAKERELFNVLIDKIKKSKEMSVSKAPRTKYLSRRLFKFDNFDIRVSFELDNDFIKYAAYGKVEINDKVSSKLPEIVDITVMDKHGKTIFARNCLEPTLERGKELKSQQMRFDKGKSIYNLLFKRSQEIAVKDVIAKQFEHATKNMGRLNKLKSVKEPTKMATMQALEKIKEL